jgi:muramoyltetrapeptide carboxypeptidase
MTERLRRVADVVGVPVPALIRPRRLTPGDRISVVAPSGPVPADRLAAGLAVLRGWGLEPVVAPHVLDGHHCGYLAAADQARADDFQDAWCDPATSAVLCARGGYGVQRMVDLLDWDEMRAAPPKALIGYSDITALHEAVATRLGLATLHGPMAAAATFLGDGPTRDGLRSTLFAPASPAAPRASPSAAAWRCSPPTSARRTPARRRPAASSCWRTSATSRTAWTAT